MAEGFLRRWSQRKVDVRLGKPLPEPLPSPATHDFPAQQMLVPSQPVPATALSDTVPAQTTPPSPTLEQAQALGLESDFKPFAVRGVDPAVSNIAMKKLFSDPHFNVMDRMDTYIDDYSQPDPLPAASLRKMVSAQFLKLLEEEPTAPSSPPLASPDHAHTDLQLQPNDAAQSNRTGEGTQ